jgi:hypothetical protein
MDNKKFEQLIELILNENEEQARTLFHDIVVEKSREIYESMMDEEMGMDEGMGGQVGDLLDEINAEEEGMTEEEDLEMDMDDESDGESDEEVVDIEGDDEMGGEEELEDRVVDLEDKLDQLMAEFEELMGGDEGGEDFGDEEGGEDFGDEEESAEEMMEAVQLQKVSVTHGDNGVQTKSPNLTNSGQAGMDSKPVKFAGAAEAVPTSPKGPSNAYAKGETQVKGAGSFKNSPGHKGQDLDKAPAPTKSQASGMNDKSPVAESKKVIKKRI